MQIRSFKNGVKNIHDQKTSLLWLADDILLLAVTLNKYGLYKFVYVPVILFDWVQRINLLLINFLQTFSFLSRNICFICSLEYYAEIFCLVEIKRLSWKRMFSKNSALYNLVQITRILNAPLMVSNTYLFITKHSVVRRHVLSFVMRTNIYVSHENKSIKCLCLLKNFIFTVKYKSHSVETLKACRKLCTVT